MEHGAIEGKRMSLARILSQHKTEAAEKSFTTCPGCRRQDFWADAYGSVRCFHCSPPPALSLVRYAFSFDPRTWPAFQPPEKFLQAACGAESNGTTPADREADEAALWETFEDVDSTIVTVRRDKIGVVGFDRKRNEKFSEWWKKGSGKKALDAVFSASENMRHRQQGGTHGNADRHGTSRQSR